MHSVNRSGVSCQYLTPGRWSVRSNTAGFPVNSPFISPFQHGKDHGKERYPSHHDRDAEAFRHSHGDRGVSRRCRRYSLDRTASGRPGGRFAIARLPATEGVENRFRQTSVIDAAFGKKHSQNRATSGNVSYRPGSRYTDLARFMVGTVVRDVVARSHPSGNRADRQQRQSRRFSRAANNLHHRPCPSGRSSSSRPETRPSQRHQLDDGNLYPIGHG
jgi:hypothetical protein